MLTALNWAGIPHSLQILARCDIMVLQEVVDSSQNTVPFLLQKLKSSRSYSFLNSSLLGRSTYKEKYVYIYRWAQGSRILIMTILGRGLKTQLFYSIQEDKSGRWIAGAHEFKTSWVIMKMDLKKNKTTTTKKNQPHKSSLERWLSS